MDGNGRSEDPRWVRFARAYLLTFAGVLGLVYAVTVLVDPYDSGRFLDLGIRGTADSKPRTAVISRARDRRFNGAIIGNSHGQLLDGRRLSAADGPRFVQLAVPGTGPFEQLFVLQVFLRHHRHDSAIVLVADHGWCSADALKRSQWPFPYGLYRGDFEYLLNLLDWDAVVSAVRRLEIVFGLRRPLDPQAAWDYEAGRTWNFHPPAAPAPSSAAVPAAEFKGRLPAVEQFAALVRTLPPQAPVVVVFPPVYLLLLPPPGSETAARMDACKHAFARIVSGHLRSGVVDLRVDGPLARDPKNFMDMSHYRNPVARQIEERIVRLLFGDVMEAGNTKAATRFAAALRAQ